jgi:hypothetical protein
MLHSEVLSGRCAKACHARIGLVGTRDQAGPGARFENGRLRGRWWRGIAPVGLVTTGTDAHAWVRRDLVQAIAPRLIVFAVGRASASDQMDGMAMR